MLLYIVFGELAIGQKEILVYWDLGVLHNRVKACITNLNPGLDTLTILTRLNLNKVDMILNTIRSITAYTNLTPVIKFRKMLFKEGKIGTIKVDRTVNCIDCLRFREIRREISLYSVFNLYGLILGYDILIFYTVCIYLIVFRGILVHFSGSTYL